MAKTNPKVDEYLKKAKRWQEELKQLRAILLDCELTEEFKWRQPCYALNGNNLIIIGAFKESCVLNFFKGVLLKDPKKLLEQPGENTQSARFMRFTSLEQITKLQPTIKAYIQEAIANEKAGKEIKYKKLEDYEIPEELEEKFKKDAKFKKAFKGLTPGRQKAYILHFAGAKQSETRKNRIENYTKRILDGKGINDCICGLSKRYPTCDGSHKQVK